MSENNVTKRTRSKPLPRVPDCSAYLLWDDRESTDIEFDDLENAAVDAAPYARARRVQVALAEAQACGMSDHTLMMVLTDWARVVARYSDRPSLRAAIEVLDALIEHGVTPTTRAHVERLEQADEAWLGEELDRTDTFVERDAYDALHCVIRICVEGRGSEAVKGVMVGRQLPVPPEQITCGGHAWWLAYKMFKTLAETAGDETPRALAECSRAMGKHIYAWGV